MEPWIMALIFPIALTLGWWLMSLSPEEKVVFRYPDEEIDMSVPFRASSLEEELRVVLAFGHRNWNSGNTYAFLRAMAYLERFIGLPAGTARMAVVDHWTVDEVLSYLVTKVRREVETDDSAT